MSILFVLNPSIEYAKINLIYFTKNFYIIFVD